MRRSVFFVEAGGSDISGALEDYLESLTINLTAKSKADTLEIELADPNGVIELPRTGTKISAGLGWSDGGPDVVFDGKVDKVTSTGSRGGGMKLTISAQSADRSGKLKDRHEKHADKGKLKETAEKFAEDAGLSVKVDEALGQIERAYWSMRNETFPAWGARIAREVGATFKIMGDVAVFVGRGSGKSASGQELTTVQAMRGPGGNIVTWSMSPTDDDDRYQKVRARWYDRKEAKWKTEDVEVEDKGASSSRTLRWSSPDKDHAKSRAGSNEKDSKREKGGGSVVIVGEPGAQPEAECEVSGTRPGIDGTYRIDAVEHRLSRGSGFETTLTLKEPSGSAGEDDRASEDGGTEE